MPDIGILKNIHLRILWEHEDEDFTPWLSENLSQLNNVYCPRKFGPPSKPRLWDNLHKLERSFRWKLNANEEDSRPSFRSEVVLEALSSESSQAAVCRRRPQPQRRPALEVEAAVP